MRDLVQLTLDFLAPARDETASLLAPMQGPAEPRTADVEFLHPRANREIRLGEARIAYEFRRGKRRTIGFSVGPDGLVVSAPRWTSIAEVHTALHEKAPWILRKLDEAHARQQKQLARRIHWRDGAELPFLGATVRLVLDPTQAQAHGGPLESCGMSEPGTMTAQVLHLGLPRQATEVQIRDAVQAWLMRQARRIFTERLDHFAPRLGVSWRRLALSSAGTRWGSARADGSIRLHWRLVHYRMEVIDYVVAHELSHLRVMDHSPHFWDTVRTVVPDYAHVRQLLKDDVLPAWA